MKKIALSMRVTEAQHYEEPRNSIAFDYISYFEKLGLLVFPVPNNTARLGDLLNVIRPEGIVLSGGNNVDPGLYGSQDQLDDVYAARDSTEKALIEYALARDLPLLGVCKGFHLINVYFGGSVSHHIPGHVNAPHALQSTDPAFNGLTVNSYHNQGIREADLSPELAMLAYTTDGFVEAFRHPDHNILGLQWHPERQHVDEDDKLIKKFFNLGS